MADGKDGQKLKLNGESAGRKKKLIIIIALVLLLAGGGAGGFFFMKGSGDAKEGAEAESAEAKAAEPADTETMFIADPEAFTFSVRDGRRSRLVQIRVAFEVTGQKNLDLAQHHLPLIRSAVFGVLDSTSFESLQSAAGREEMRKKALEAARTKVQTVASDPLLNRMFFTALVVQ